MTTKAELEAKIELLEAEIAGIARVEEENYKLKKKIASLSYKLKEQREYARAAQAEVRRLMAVVEAVDTLRQDAVRLLGAPR